MRFIKSVGILFLFVCQEIYAVNKSTVNASEEIGIRLLPLPVNGEEKIYPRIVGGTRAIKGQFRGIVSIQLIDGGHFCGGTLYKNSKNVSFVLTAAHCTKDVKPKTIRIVGDDLNNRDRSNDTNRQIRKVKSIIEHPNYLDTERTIINDIAIIILTKPFHITETFGPVSLPENDVIDNQACSVAGWGTLKHGKDEIPPDELYAVDINIIPLNVCTPPLNMLNLNIGPNAICAGSLMGGRDSCQGDSGGGLICANRLAGIVSFGFGCAKKGYPGVYTNVYRYKDWIEKNNSSSFNPMISLLLSSIGILILNFFF